ncbi:MAG: hypothetical protein NC548_51265 [Lachnospiraceae bacterium]|nr:hypothetical protein [Lachnospiraceae bacterium]
MSKMKTADEILAANKCGDLFSCRDKDKVRAEYKQMARAYHPDICTLPNASAVFAKLNELHDKAMKLIEKGEWEVSNLFEIRDTKGRRYSTKYLKSFTFELGTAYIADQSLTYLFDTEHTAFYENAVAQINNIKYANARMEQEFSRLMPKVKYTFRTDDGRCCLILNKTPDVFLLSDVLDFYNGQIPDRHVAWIVSRLCNLCCFFDYTGISHNGLVVQNCLVSPQYHSLLPLGGWWYAREHGRQLLGVPKAVYDVMPIKAKSDKISAIGTDLEAAKLIGRQISDISTIPVAVKEFLEAGASSKAKDEFSKWNAALDRAYGERKFIEMKVSKSDIYR